MARWRLAPPSFWVLWHAVENIAYFAPMDAPLSQNTLIYLIAHPSREAADQDWAAFQKDPEWQAGGTHAGSKQ